MPWKYACSCNGYTFTGEKDINRLPLATSSGNLLPPLPRVPVCRWCRAKKALTGAPCVTFRRVAVSLRARKRGETRSGRPGREGEWAAITVKRPAQPAQPPVRQLLGPANAEATPQKKRNTRRSGRWKVMTRCSTRREERVTRVLERQLPHPSACRPGRPPLAPRCRVREAQLLHPCARCTCARAHSANPPPRDALEGGEVAPTPSRAPSPCPATVSLTPSAAFNGICNRQ